MSTPPDSRETFHHGDLRRALLAAAHAALEREGLGGLGLRELARAVGVSPAAPYRHFKNRDALLAALAAQGFARLNHLLVRAQDRVAPAQQLLALGLAYVEFARRHPALFQLMFSPLAGRNADPDLRAEGARAFALLKAAAARETPDTPNETALSAWAQVHGLAQLRNDGRIAGGDALVRTLLDGFVAGIRARRAG